MMLRRSLLGLALPAAAWAQARPKTPPLLYIGAFPGQILIFDEDQEKVIDHIKLQTGIPRGLTHSWDRKQFYVYTARGGIEVVDPLARRVTNHFTLDSPSHRVRPSGFAIDPQGKVLYTILRGAVKKIDRFEIDKPKFGVIDLAEKKVTRTADLPRDEEAGLGFGADLRVSPDGKYLYAFQENVLIFDTADFKLVEKIELAKPPYPWMATLNLGFRDDPNEDRGTLTGVFNSTDPVVRRSIFGIARFDLNKRTFEFTPIGPSANNGVMGLQITPDRKTGYTVVFQGDTGNRRVEFWVFDMTTLKVTRRVEFDGPVNFRFTLSGDGKRIYVHGTAPGMEIYDAATLQKRKAVDMNADLTTNFLLPPRPVS